MQDLTYNIVDFVVLAALVIGLIQGLRRGLSGELARLIGTVAAVWAGWYFYHPLGAKLLNSTRLSEQDANAVAFFLCLAGVFIAILLLRLMLRRIMEITIKGGTLERLGGLCAGVLRMLLACAAIVFFLSLLPSEYIHTAVAEKSLFGRIITRHAPALYNQARTWFPGIPALPENAPPDDQSQYDPANDIPAGTLAEPVEDTQDSP
jgi:uncharacterized membrane protein required for colicin V production